MLMLISASSGNSEGTTNSRRWIIGALTQQGFENKDIFYGSSGNLYAISPVFHSFSPSGKQSGHRKERKQRDFMCVMLHLPAESGTQKN